MSNGLLRRIDRIGERLESLILMGIMLVLLLLVVLQVLARLVEQPPTWTEEVSRYLMVWLAFFGAAVCVRHNEHVGFTLLADSLPEGAARWVRAFAHIICFIFMAIVLVQGAVWLSSLMHSGQTTITFQLQLYWIASAIPLAGLLGAIHAIRLLINDQRPEHKISDIQ